MKPLRTLLSVLFASLLGTTTSQAAVRYVDAAAGGANDGTSWADAYTSLQTALAASSSADQLWVKAGTYRTTAVGNFFSVPGGVSVYGGFDGTESALASRDWAVNTTTLSGDYNNTPGTLTDDSNRIVNFPNGADGSTLDGFTIKNGYKTGTTFGVGVVVEANNTTVRHCIITECYGDYGGAVGSGAQTTKTGNQFINCAIINNLNTVVGLGDNSAAAYWRGAVSFINCTFYGNNDTPLLKPAIQMRSGGPMTFLNCILWDHQNTYLGGGVFLNSGSIATTYTDSRGAAHTGTGNFSTDPAFTSGFDIDSSSPCFDTGTATGAPTTDIYGTARPQGTAHDIGAMEAADAGPTTSSTTTTTTTTTTTSSTTTTAAAGTEEVTVQTNPVNAGFLADSVEYFTTSLFNWVDPSSHTLSVSNPVQVNAGTQYRFLYWNDNDLQLLNDSSETVNYEVDTLDWGNGPFTVTASFDTYYLLTKAGANGTITNHPTVGDNYFVTGTPVFLYPNPDTGYVFTHWTGAASGDAVPLEVTMDSAKSITANYKQVYFVKHDATGAGDGSSWANAYTTIGAALSSTPTGSEIWVAAGTYNTPTTASALTVRANDELYGGFAGTENARGMRDIQANATIISGDTNNDDVSDMTGASALLTSSGANTAYATVDGFTFQYGRYTTSGKYGGAITRQSTGAAFRIRNSVFRNNISQYGGAIGIASADPSYIENCIFYNNSTLAGDGHGGAIYHRRGTSMVLLNSTFYDNVANSGVADDVYRHVSAAATIQNSIMWSSTDPLSSGTATTYSNIRQPGVGVFTGTGNINADPLFYDAAGRDFRLQDGSTSINAGSSGGGAPTRDIRGNVRPIGANHDMGAYEMEQFTDVTVTASPNAGQTVTVQGVSAVVPNTYTVEVGVVEMSLDSPQTFGSVRYVFDEWDDGDSNTSSDNPFEYTAVVSVTRNWQAIFNTEYLVQAFTNPAAGAGTASVDAWVQSGQQATFSATADPGWSFVEWREGVDNSIVSVANPYSPTIISSTNLTAVFACTGESITVEADPVGPTISVNGSDYTAPITFCWVATDTHSFSAMDVFEQTPGQVEYRFTYWSDTQAQSELTTNWTYTVPGVDATATANYDTYYKLTVSFNTGGTVSTNPYVADAYHLSGANVQLTATPDSGYIFLAWGGDESGTANPLTVNMNGAKSVTATFQRIYYVDASATGANNGLSWADAYPTLSAALTAAPAGSEFWVAAGTYHPPTTSSALVLDWGDAIYGGFAGNESTRDARDPAVNVSIISGDTNNDQVSDMAGSSPLMTSVGNNSAYCEVDGFTFAYGKFTSGAAYGGAISKGNPGAAFRIRRSIFRDNEATFGGAIGIASHGNGDGEIISVENSLFYNNTATDGGAFFVRRGSNVDVINNTFMDNAASGGPDDVSRHVSAALTIVNSILWSSTAPIAAGTGTAVSYSNVRQPVTPFPGTGNINADPLFVNTGIGDYRLQEGSPAVDQGTSTGAPDIDLLGVARPINGLWDMGAYEGGVSTALDPQTIIRFQ